MIDCFSYDADSKICFMGDLINRGDNNIQKRRSLNPASNLSTYYFWFRKRSDRSYRAFIFFDLD